MTDCNFKCLPFNKLSPSELLALLTLRSEAFVTEQKCIYNDPDSQDRESFHMIGTGNSHMIAYARIFSDEHGTWHIGRVLVSSAFRSQGISSKLMNECFQFVEEQKGTIIQLSAQAYLEGYYQSFGFKTKGNLYLEDGIPHLNMTYAQSLTTTV